MGALSKGHGTAHLGFPSASESMTSRYSRVSLKGAVSNDTLPGELEMMKPKSMWTTCPSASIITLPLCLSLAWRMYMMTE